MVVKGHWMLSDSSPSSTVSAFLSCPLIFLHSLNCSLTLVDRPLVFFFYYGKYRSLLSVNGDNKQHIELIAKQHCFFFWLMLHLYPKILGCMHSFKAMQKQRDRGITSSLCLEVTPKKDTGSEQNTNERIKKSWLILHLERQWTRQCVWRIKKYEFTIWLFHLCI